MTMKVLFFAIFFALSWPINAEAATRVRVIYDPGTVVVLRVIIPDEDGDLRFHGPAPWEAAIDIPRQTYSALSDKGHHPDTSAIANYISFLFLWRVS